MVIFWQGVQAHVEKPLIICAKNIRSMKSLNYILITMKLFLKLLLVLIIVIMIFIVASEKRLFPSYNLKAPPPTKLDAISG